MGLRFVFFLSHSSVDTSNCWWPSRYFSCAKPGFVGGIVRKRIVPEPTLPALSKEIEHATPRKDSLLAEAACLLAAILLSLVDQSLQLLKATAAHDQFHAAADLTMAGLWYWIVCLPLFRFLLFACSGGLANGRTFLAYLQIGLHSVPTHPDGVAGLGCLEVLHTCFIALVLSISAIESASLAEEISLGSMAFEAIYPSAVLILFVDAVLFVGHFFCLRLSSLHAGSKASAIMEISPHATFRVSTRSGSKQLIHTRFAVTG
jgi:hypothetical protein